MKFPSTALTALVLTWLLPHGTSYAAPKESPAPKDIGRVEFQQHCAACHGAGGKGDGPLVEFLKRPPPDLTTLSDRHGGDYPQEQVYEWIRNPESIRAHGSKTMPIWGDRYSHRVVNESGHFYDGPGQKVQQRVLELVYYIGSVQEISMPVAMEQAILNRLKGGSAAQPQ